MRRLALAARRWPTAADVAASDVVVTRPARLDVQGRSPADGRPPAAVPCILPLGDVRCPVGARGGKALVGRESPPMVASFAKPSSSGTS